MRPADGDDADDTDDTAGLDPAGVEGVGSAWPEICALRQSALVVAAAHAAQLEQVAALASRAEREARLLLAASPRTAGQPADDAVLDSEVTLEVQTALGLSRHDAGALVDLAERLVHVLPDTLAALATGRLDQGRARAVAELTGLLDDPTARAVEAQLLARAGQRPWTCVSPRAWRARIARAVVKADPDAVRRRREQALADRSVRVWANGDGTSQLMACGADEDVQLADQVLTDLAHALAQAERDQAESGEHPTQRRSIDQLRADALFDLLRRVRDGEALPGLPVRREREVGLVLHADTFFGDGPAAHDPGQRRGPGSPGPVDPHTARTEAHRRLERGTALRVLLTDATGALVRVLRFPSAPPGGWTRAALHEAVRDRISRVGQLPDFVDLATHRYTPTAAILDHVRTRNPTCTGYDCPRAAHCCDLDHDTPWPRGPTHPDNLAPRCRRDHQLKTRGLVVTRLHPDGSVTTAMPSGTVHTTAPEPLPGHGIGEAYETAPRPRS